MGIVCSLDTLKFIKNGPKVSLCHGVFDVLHEGHLSYLEEAKKLAPQLVVSITSDKYVNKGPGRPYFSEQTRARMIAALDVVDYVIINDEPRATNIIKAIKPNYYVKGQDYKNPKDDLTGGILEEESAVKEVGGEMIFTNKPTHSSSTLINKFFNTMTEEQNDTILRVKEAGGLEKIQELFKEIERYYVTVVGEPIVDTYTFCTPEGISSKSATISARYLKEENYAGGSLAIANHLVDFVKGVTLHAPHGKELYYQEIKNTLVDKRITYANSMIPSYTTPRKTRYIDEDKNQRIFEMTNISPNLWSNNNPKFILDDIHRSAEASQAVLLCDFGHGLFENGFLSGLSDMSSFIALNCQTNSSNFGFNPYTKHKDFNYLSIDLKEARIAFHDRLSDARTLFSKIGAQNVSMTLGSAGALYKSFSQTSKAPAFSDGVIDAIGAGDAYYAITSLLVKAGSPPDIVPFVGNIFAGLKTKIIGNKHAVTKAQLFKAIEAILK